MDSVCSNVIAREGIQTVAVENHCNFSRNSDLCICVVTWNMNGQVVCLINVIFTLVINVVISKGLDRYLPHFYVIFTCSPLLIMLFLLCYRKVCCIAIMIPCWTKILVRSWSMVCNDALLREGFLWRFGGVDWKQPQVWSADSWVARGASKQHCKTVEESCRWDSRVKFHPHLLLFT